MVHAPDLISIVVPALDEERALGACLDAALAQAPPLEIVLADGGSRDRTCAIAVSRGVRVVTGPRGRAAQMNHGAAAAAGRVLLFLHADTRLPAGALAAVRAAIAAGAEAGAFRLGFDRPGPDYALAARLSDLWCAASGDLFGDRALFCVRGRFAALGGFRLVPLMEDLDFAVRLRRAGARVRLLRPRVVTSARRFRGGIGCASLHAARLVLAFHRGRDLDRLAARYYAEIRR